MITRFAPSPTGYLHLGNIRTALLAYFNIKSLGGKFILRIDDTDTSRVKNEYIDQIIKDLDWLGIKYNQMFKQSERFARYKEVLDALIASNRVYPCWETQEELEFKRKSLLKRGLAPVYDRESLKIQKPSQSRAPYYRFKIDYDDVICWEDELRGKITVDLKSTSDPIVLRENGLYTYMLPSAIDDMDYSIDTVVRGEDHISNTAVQIQMLKAIGSTKIPTFAHIPLVKTNHGKVSKRVGGYEIKTLKEEDFEPQVIVNYLINLGNRVPIDKYNLEDIIKEFKLSNYSPSPVMLDVDDIQRLNRKFLQNCEFVQIKNSLPKEIDENFWKLVRGNLDKKLEVSKWHAICKPGAKIDATASNKELIKKAISLLPNGQLAHYTYKIWVDALLLDENYTKKDVSMNLRVSLTGLLKGPELGTILPIIGRDEVIRRLEDQIA